MKRKKKKLVVVVRLKLKPNNRHSWAPWRVLAYQSRGFWALATPQLKMGIRGLK